MEELVKTGDYATLVAHCEDAELKVLRVCMCVNYAISPVINVNMFKHKIFYRRLMELLIHKYTVAC